MVTGVLGGGRTGIRMNNPLLLMFPVLPSARRERPPRLFQLTSTGNSTGMRIPARGLLIIGSPSKRAIPARKVYFVSAFVTIGKLLAVKEIFWGQSSRPTPKIKPAGMANQWKATAAFPIPAARQELRCSRQTGSRIMALSGGPDPSAFPSVHRRGRF